MIEKAAHKIEDQRAVWAVTGWGQKKIDQTSTENGHAGERETGREIERGTEQRQSRLSRDRDRERQTDGERKKKQTDTDTYTERR